MDPPVTLDSVDSFTKLEILRAVDKAIKLPPQTLDKNLHIALLNLVIFPDDLEKKFLDPNEPAVDLNGLKLEIRYALGRSKKMDAATFFSNYLVRRSVLRSPTFPFSYTIKRRFQTSTQPLYPYNAEFLALETLDSIEDYVDLTSMGPSEKDIYMSLLKMTKRIPPIEYMKVANDAELKEMASWINDWQLLNFEIQNPALRLAFGTKSNIRDLDHLYLWALEGDAKRLPLIHMYLSRRKFQPSERSRSLTKMMLPFEANYHRLYLGQVLKDVANEEDRYANLKIVLDFYFSPVFNHMPEDVNGMLKILTDVFSDPVALNALGTSASLAHSVIGFLNTALSVKYTVSLNRDQRALANQLFSQLESGIKGNNQNTEVLRKIKRLRARLSWVLGVCLNLLLKVFD